MTLYGVWDLRGNKSQNDLVVSALKACYFPFDKMLPSLAKEGKKSIVVSWKDLSRASESNTAGAHVLESRQATLGLFYLPPYTSIVLDVGLTKNPALAKEVFLSEAAHAVDYHYMTNAHRLAFWNAIHTARQDLPANDIVEESGDQSHGHSWFDGQMGYGTWVGEAWMEGFVKAFAPTIPVTIQMSHVISKTAARTIRRSLLTTQPRRLEDS